MLRLSLKVPYAPRSHRRGSEASENDSRLQSLELCFHDDFAPDDAQPISLHFRSNDTTCFKTSLVYPTPTPPCYIHELGAIMDLTTPWGPEMEEEDDASISDREASPDGNEGPAVLSLSQRLGSLYGSIFFCGMGMMLLVGLGMAALCFTPCFTPWLRPPQSSPEFVFRHNVSAKNVSLALHRQILQLEHLRISSVQDLLSYAKVERDPDFHEVSSLIEALCQTTIHITSIQKGHRDEEAEMACSSLIWHSTIMKSHWRSVGAETLHDWPNKTLNALRRTHNGIDPDSGTRRVAWVYKTLEDADWVRSCKFCEWDAHGVRGWHFACEESFRALLPAYTTDVPDDVTERAREYLGDWADRHTRRRAETMRDPGWSVKGGLDGHPIDSCPEITNHKLGVEDSIVSVARHMFEMRADFRRLAVLLQKHGLAPGLRRLHPDSRASAHPTPMPTVSPQARATATHTDSPMYRMRRIFRDSLGMGDAPSSSAMDKYIATIDSNAVKLSVILDSLEDFERALARAALGHVSACTLGRDLWKYLGALNKGMEPSAWDVAVEGASPAAAGTPQTVTLQVSYTSYTMDPVEAAARLADGVAHLSSAFPPFPTRTPVVFEKDEDVDAEEVLRQHPWMRDLMDFQYALSKVAEGDDLNATMQTREGTLLRTATRGEDG
ncbi:hypothetical protein CkaCkLH20_12613 [Colletotrichum karsti]|uniref:Uncharacterized protein n=1 Tax=Colletotrichum karsti TaxID=1095194 RepID=A0A9P6HVZ9_9PEZI|nr:uncharacterized protein CkaCkLH20_12613 [Colletotrichum karsti]KAF9869906.1 hypothetical protein CkaCkLH20_12613 [Colletotrichum karsti]